MIKKTQLFFLILPFSFLFGQPTDQKVKELSASVSKFSGQTADEISRKAILETEYLEKAKKNIELYRKGDASINVIDFQGKPIKNLKIEINQISQDFLFGNLAFEIGGFSPEVPFKVDEFREKFKALFNLAVLPFYWNGYEKRAGSPEWYKNTNALDWCLENGITVKGHPLGWTGPAGTPKWLLKLPEETATELYKARICNNVIGYKGKIDIWDVVNEPVNTVPWEMALKDTLNNNDFRYNMKGIKIEQIVPWVEKSFKWANQANPEGNYILNEYFTLAIPEVRDRFYELIKELRLRNTPIKGIGIQGHEPREMWFSPVEVYKTFDLYKEFNLPIHITELIPQSSGKDITGWRTGKWTEEAQAEFAQQFYTLAFGHPSVASINWWGLSDRNIWLSGGGLLDKDYNPKPVYNTLLKLIKTDWMTKNVLVTTNKKGQTRFRGFYGEYQIVITKPDGTKMTIQKHLKEKTENNWVIHY
jgi:endo-1,4-beta-xylanase